MLRGNSKVPIGIVLSPLLRYYIKKPLPKERLTFRLDFMDRRPDAGEGAGCACRTALYSPFSAFAPRHFAKCRGIFGFNSLSGSAYTPLSRATLLAALQTADWQDAIGGALDASVDGGVVESGSAG